MRHDLSLSLLAVLASLLSSCSPSAPNKCFDVGPNGEQDIDSASIGYVPNKLTKKPLAALNVTALPTVGSVTLNAYTVPAPIILPASPAYGGFVKYTAPLSGSNTATMIFKVVDQGDEVAESETTLAFYSPARVLPTVSFSAPTSLAAYSVTLNGGVTGTDSRTPIAGRGFVYALGTAAGDPVIGGSGSTQVFATGTATFSAAANGLEPSTSYKYRAYVLTSCAAGHTHEHYGATETFTTPAASTSVAPAGADKPFAVENGSSTPLSLADWGFTDTDGNAFTAVKITALPKAGKLLVDGDEVTAGQTISLRKKASGTDWKAVGVKGNWRGLACSANGSRLAAVADNGGLYTSSDGGLTWVLRDTRLTQDPTTPPPVRNWRSIAGSADGMKLAAVVVGGLIYTSIDGGDRWMERASARQWSSITSSADGQKLAAVVNGGHIHISANGGETWEAKLTDANRQWTCITSSYFYAPLSSSADDGKYLAAASWGGGIWKSSDHGASWTQSNAPSSPLWTAITCSADGRKMFTVGPYAGLYASDDFGANWIVRSNQKKWALMSWASALDIGLLPGLVDNEDLDGFRISRDAGQTWIESSQTFKMSQCGAGSADGTTLAFAEEDGRIYISKGESVITYQAPAGTGSGSDMVSFQVQDAAPTNNLDLSPNTLTFNYSKPSSNPTGKDSKIFVRTGTTYTVKPSDWGFKDKDTPPNDFTAVQITSTTVPSGFQANAAPVITDQVLPIGETMVPMGPTANWRSIASDSTGNRLAAVVDGGQLYTSENAGGLWTAQNTRTAEDGPGSSAPDRQWSCVARSGNGNTIIAGVRDGSLYISTDAGASWVRPSDTSMGWLAVASDSTGTRLAAASGLSDFYTSRDSGATWQTDGAFSTVGAWGDLASSDDGEKLVAAPYSEGKIGIGTYLGTNSTVSLWSVGSIGQNGDWSAVACDSTATKLIAGSSGGLYTSAGSGQPLIQRIAGQRFDAVGSSSDGSVLTAGVGGGDIYRSTDSGVTWKKLGANGKWRRIASSADGMKVVASRSGTDFLYTLKQNSAITYTPPASGSGSETVQFRVKDSGAAASNTAVNANTLTFKYSLPVPPIGVDNTFTDVDPNGSITLDMDAFGFSDDADPVHDDFAAVKIASLPTAGTLRINGEPATAGDLPVEWPLTTVFTFDAPASGEPSFTFRVKDSAPNNNLAINTNTIYFKVKSPPVLAAPISLASPGMVTLQSAITSNGGSDNISTGFVYALTSDNAAPTVGGAGVTTLYCKAPESPNSTFFTVIEGLLPKRSYSFAAFAETKFPRVHSSVGTFTMPSLPPSGTEITINVVSGSNTTIQPSDWGFSDEDDAPVDTQRGVRITTLPTAGTLFVDGSPAVAQNVAIFPDAITYTAPAGMGSASFTFEVIDSGGAPFNLDPKPKTMTFDYAPSTANPRGRTNRTTVNAGSTTTLNSGLFGFSDAGDSSPDLFAAVHLTSLPNAAVGKLQVDGMDAAPNKRFLIGSTLTFVATSTGGSTSFDFRVEDDGAADNLALNANTLRITSTVTPTAPVVTTPTTDKITSYSASLGGNVTSDGNSKLLGTGVVYALTSEDADPRLGDANVKVVRSLATTKGVFSVPVGVEPLKQYTFRAYAANTLGISYSNALTFNTVAKPTSPHQPPTGETRSLAVQTGSVTTLTRSDWGFADADTPPDAFIGVKITGLPATGSLLRDGFAIAKDETLSVRVPWAPTGPSLAWRSVASDKTGKRLVAVAYNDHIYISDNSGVTWKPAETTRGYYYVTSNADGKVLAAVSYSPASEIIVSTDFGQSWTPRDVVRDWACITSNEAGDKLAAVVFGGFIYTSDNGGDSWQQRAHSSTWHSITSSADGMRLAAVAYGGNVWISTDAGQTWTPKASVQNWLSIASSDDGEKLVAAGDGTQIWTSTDGGDNWTARDAARSWRGITSSADGTRLAACHFGGQIYTSTDSGLNWTAQPGSPNCRCIDSSADGTFLIAGSDGGQLYTFSGPTPIITYTAPTTGTADASFTFKVQDSADNDNLDLLDRKLTFNYAPTAPPVLGVPAARDVFINRANLLGTIASNGGSPITELGFVYASTARNARPVIGGSAVVQKPCTLAQGLNASESGLQPGTNYSLRSYAKNAVGLSYSEPVTFRTPPLLGRLEISSPEEIRPFADDDNFSFGNAATGATKTRTFIVRNVGSVKLINIVAPITGTNAANFTRTLPTSVLEPGASMKVDITFAPTAQGAATATIAFSSSDTSQPAQRVNLSGNGVAPGAAALSVKAGDTQLTDNVGSVDYGSVPLGKDAEKVFTLTNTGANNLTGLSLKVIGKNLTNVILPTLSTNVLSAGDSISFAVLVRPSVTGPISATLQITSNDTTAQPAFDIPLIATGIVPVIEVKQNGIALKDGTAFKFPTALAAGTPDTRSFTVKNIGSSALTLGAITIDGASAADFSATVPGSLTLGPSMSTTFDVTFRPSTGGARSAALHLLTSDAKAPSFDLLLSGTGTGSEISVTAGTVQFVSNGPAIDFGEVITNSSSAVRTYTIKNLGNSPLNEITVGSNSQRFVVGGTPAASLDAGKSTTFTLIFSPDADATFNGTLSIASNDLDEGTFTLPLTGKGAPDTAPNFNPGPQDQIVAAGRRVTFGATVTSPLTFNRQWLKGITSFANIKGATAPTYTIETVTLTDAAVRYQLRATNTAGTKQSVSTPAALTVVDLTSTSQTLQTTKNATLAVSAASSGALTYVWKKVGDPSLPSNAIASENKLTFTNLVPTNAGTYTCDVTGPGGTMTSGNHALSVFSIAPVISSTPPPPSSRLAAAPATPITLTLPDAFVGGDYTYQIPLASPSNGNASSYACTPLPLGMLFDAKTGRLYGSPTKAGPYSLKLTATNALGSSTATGSLTVRSDQGSSVTGTYIGLIERGPITSGLGGRLDLTIANSSKSSTTRGLTGSVTLGTVKTAFTGSLVVGDLSTSITILRNGLPNLTLALALDPVNNRFAASGSTLTDGTSTSAISGWRFIWSSTNPPATYQGAYNFALVTPEDSSADSIPFGFGYGTFTVAKTGAVTVTGRLPDGDVVTGSSPLGPNGELAVYSVLAGKGSLLGSTQINPGATNSDNTLSSGSLTWTRPATAITSTTKSTLYASGFGPIVLTCAGGRYIPPVTPGLLMGKAPGIGNASLRFYDANIGGPPSPADCAVTVTTTTATIGTTPTLTKITVTGPTGAFSGSFILKDNHPFLSGAPIITRPVTFNGLIIPTATGQRGYGYFLLPQLPVKIYPAPPASSLSGGVELE